MKTELISHKELLEEIFYDPQTGIFTRKKSCKGAKAGDIVGCLRKDGYLVTSIHKKFFYLHRLAWFYVYGEHPKNLIDHIDRNKKNNKIENLRIVNYAENSQNSNKHKDNTSGYKGVWKHTKNRWRAGICVNGKMDYLGTFLQIEDAVIAYETASKEKQKFGVFKNV